MRTYANRGFTLIESIMVIVITGIVATTVAVFIKPAIDAYTSSVHRAELTDAVDTALRRLARDVRTAVPNSLRQHSDTCIEYAPIKAAGRYRKEGAGALDFITPADSFAVLSMTPTAMKLEEDDQIVIYNLGRDVAEVDLFSGSNRARVSVAATQDSTHPITNISIDKKLFPLASPGGNFQVIPASGPVAVVCDNVDTVGGNGTGRLLLRRGQSYVPAIGTCPTGTSDALLVDRVSACVFNYQSDVLKRHGLLTVSLSLTRDGETVNLVQQIHVDNIP